VLERRRLQLDVEAPAEALAERQPPRLVDARAVRRMHNEMAVAGLVEEALEHDPLVRRKPAERRLRGREVVDELSRRVAREAVVAAHRFRALLRGRDLELAVDTRA